MTTAANTSHEPDAPSGRRRLILLLQSLPHALRDWWSTQRQWLWVLIPLVIISAGCIGWAIKGWLDYDYAQLYQAIVPFAAAWTTWMRRNDAANLIEELDFLFPGDSPKKRGNLSLVLFGCLLLVISYLATIIQPAFIGFICILIGSIYYLYGPFVLRAFWQTFAFLLLMMPLPSTLILYMASRMQVGTALITGQILQGIVPGTKPRGLLITLPGYPLPISTGLSGLNILLPVMVATIWIAMQRRLRADVGVLLVLISGLISLMVNILRALIIGLLGNSNSSWAEAILPTGYFLFIPKVVIHMALLIGLSLYLTMLVARLLPMLHQRRLTEFEEDLIEAQQYTNQQAAARTTTPEENVR